MFDKFVGIDVSKSFFDLHFLPDGTEKQFDNNKKGFKQCFKFLGSSQGVLVVLEATGGYEFPLFDALQEAGFSVAIVNPRRVRDFAKASGQMAKTDKLDAKIIAQFAHKFEPPPREKVDEHLFLLRQMVTRRDQLSAMKTSEKNRLEHPSGKLVRKSILKLISTIEKELKSLEKEIQNHIDQTPSFKKRKEILKSVPGVGDATASMIIAQLPELGSINRRQVAALVGVAPFNRDSGTFRGKRMTGGGRRQIRKTLFMATLVASRHNSVIRSFYNTLLQNGKSKMTAIVASMRKLLTILNSMLKYNQPWNPLLS